MLALTRSMGHPHPALVEPHQLRLLTDDFAGRQVEEVFGYAHKWRATSDARRAELTALAATASRSASSSPAEP